MADAQQTRLKPSQRQLAEALAKWLNGACVDFPPIGYDWESAPAWRKKAMREMAARAMSIVDGKESSR